MFLLCLLSLIWYLPSLFLQYLLSVSTVSPVSAPPVSGSHVSPPVSVSKVSPPVSGSKVSPVSGSKGSPSLSGSTVSPVSGSRVSPPVWFEDVSSCLWF